MDVGAAGLMKVGERAMRRAYLLINKGYNIRAISQKGLLIDRFFFNLVWIHID
jgi:hypothetical protein